MLCNAGPAALVSISAAVDGCRLRGVTAGRRALGGLLGRLPGAAMDGVAAVRSADMATSVSLCCNSRRGQTVGIRQGCQRSKTSCLASRLT